MGNGHGPGFLRVVHEVALGIVVGFLTDNLDGVFVGADGTIGAEAVEQGANGTGSFGVEVVVPIEGGMGDIVDDTTNEVVLGFGGDEVIEDRQHHSRVELLGTQSVATGIDARHGGQRTGIVGERLHEGGLDILIHRIADGAGFFGSIQNGDALGGFGQCGEKILDAPRPEETDLDHSDFSSLRHEMLHHLMHGFRARAHDDHDIFGVGSTDIVEQVVVPSGQLGETIHVLLHDARAVRIKAIHGLAMLKEHVRVLRRASQNRSIR